LTVSAREFGCRRASTIAESRNAPKMRKTVCSIARIG
jgi:hypothetical protein